MLYKISDLAKILGVTSNTIRRYENNGYLHPYRDDSDYRWYGIDDIMRTAAIRLYRKCGFSHNEIMDMLNSDSKNVIDVYTERLNKIDAEINRLKYLRHWLKDNVKLMNTVRDMGDGYIIMECRPLKYVLYSINGKILTEKERLNTINLFMYHVHEVQLMYFIKKDEIANPSSGIGMGLIMKETDIRRLNLEDKITPDTPFVENYPSKKCLFSVFEYPSAHLKNSDELFSAINSYKEKPLNYMKSQGYTVDGDITLVVANVVGNSTELLFCIPFQDKSN